MKFQIYMVIAFALAFYGCDEKVIITHDTLFHYEAAINDAPSDSGLDIPVVTKRDSEIPTEAGVDAPFDITPVDSPADIPIDFYSPDTTIDLPPYDSTVDSPLPDITMDLPPHDTTVDIPTTDTTVDSTPPACDVFPATNFTSSGGVGGPFNPIDQTYTLVNSTTATMTYTISVDQNWVSISSPTTGTITPSWTVANTVSINAQANSLAPGSYTAVITYYGTTSTTNCRSTIVVVLNVIGIAP